MTGSGIRHLWLLLVLLINSDYRFQGKAKNMKNILVVAFVFLTVAAFRNTVAYLPTDEGSEIKFKINIKILWKSTQNLWRIR